MRRIRRGKEKEEGYGGSGGHSLRLRVSFSSASLIMWLVKLRHAFLYDLSYSPTVGEPNRRSSDLLNLERIHSQTKLFIFARLVL
ncbi:hypothetical protein N665_0091s0007 [Sinapis alba]|nr:hypothetical protein N665_0091s0007 [Sinapis alba]